MDRIRSKFATHFAEKEFLQFRNDMVGPPPARFDPKFMEHNLPTETAFDGGKARGQKERQSFRVETVGYKLEAHPIGLEFGGFFSKDFYSFGPTFLSGKPKKIRSPKQPVFTGIPLQMAVVDGRTNAIMPPRSQFRSQARCVIAHPVSSRFERRAEEKEFQLNNNSMSRRIVRKFIIKEATTVFYLLNAKTNQEKSLL
jgi:hypothetical protein